MIPDYKFIEDNYSEVDDEPETSSQTEQEPSKEVVKAPETKSAKDSKGSSTTLPVSGQTEQSTTGSSTRTSGTTRTSGNELPEDFSVDDAREYHVGSGERFYSDDLKKFEENADDPEVLSRMFLPSKPVIQDTERMRQRSRLGAIANGLGLFVDAIAGSKGAWLIPSKDDYEEQEQKADAIDSRNSQLSTEYNNAVSKAKENYRRLLEAGAARQAKNYQNYKTQKYNSSETISEEDYDRISDSEKKGYSYDRSSNRYVRNTSGGGGYTRANKPYAGFELPNGEDYVFTEANFYKAHTLFSKLAADEEFNKQLLKIPELVNNDGKIELTKVDKHRLIDAFNVAITTNPNKFYKYAADMGLIEKGTASSTSSDFKPFGGRVNLYGEPTTPRAKGQVDTKLKLN